MTFTLEAIVRRFGGEIIGDSTHRVDGLAPLDRASQQQLAFLANPKYLSQVEKTQAGAVLISAIDLAKLVVRDGRNFIVTSNPYVYFARVAQAFIDLATPKIKIGSVHPRASVDLSATIATSAVIGPNVTVEAGAIIGENVWLAANVFVGRTARIDADSHVHSNVTIYHGCQIGKRTIIHAGAVIGSDGFGFASDFTDEDEACTGSWVKIPQMGGVMIGPDVEIGANTTIDRGVMLDTVIEEGVKIDNLVQIGHNCHIGAYTVIAGCAGIAGSTIIGRRCMIGGAVGIAGHVTLTDYVVVTAKSGVSKSLLKPGIYTSTFPAVDHGDWNRNVALMRNLDKLRDRIKALETTVAAAQASSSKAQSSKKL